MLESTEAEHIGGFPFHSTFFPEKHNELALINNLLPNMHICIVLVHFKAFFCTRTKIREFPTFQGFASLLQAVAVRRGVDPDRMKSASTENLRRTSIAYLPSSMLRADESRAPHHLDGPRR